MAILIKSTGEVLDWPLSKSDMTAVPKGNSLIAYEHWDKLAAEKGTEAAVVATLKAVDTRQPAEKRLVPAPVKIEEEGTVKEGIKTK